MRAVGEVARQALQSRAAQLDAARLQALSPLLFVVPHPDDEVLGCGGLIAESSDQNLDVRVVYLTDGAASHLGSPTWPPDRLASVRRGEALRALGVLGVKPQNVLFLDWPDASPYPPHSQPFKRSVERVVTWRGGSPPRSILAPYKGEGHCDHQAASALAGAVSRLWTSPPPMRFEYLVWGWSDSGIADILSGRTLWRLACAHQVARRRRALACHATQHGKLINDALQSFALPQALAALTDCPSEVYLES